jgi:hypothetical protein
MEYPLSCHKVLLTCLRVPLPPALGIGAGICAVRRAVTRNVRRSHRRLARSMCPPARVPTPRQSHPRRRPSLWPVRAREWRSLCCSAGRATFVRSAVTRALQPAILPIAVHGLPVDSSHSVSGGLGPANKTLLCPRGKCELLAREYSHRRRRSRYTCGGRTLVRRPTGCLLDPYATPCHASLHPPARRSVVTAAPGLRVMRR